MKKLFTYLFFIIFSFQTPSQADDIRDFQIEGMSIGDSALDYFSEAEIKNNKRNYYRNNEFSDSEITISGELYKSVHINYKTDDDKYIMEGISGTILYKHNVKDCYKKRDEIVKEISSVFTDTKPKNAGKVKHGQDKTGKSTLSNILFHFKAGDLIMVSCYDWSKEMKYTDHLRISFGTKKFGDFISYKAYK